MKVTLDSRPDISSQDIWLSRLKTIFIGKVNTDISRDGCLDLLKWIKKSDFFTCPASSRFHSNFLGGLCYHTLAVYSCLNRLIKAHSLEKIVKKLKCCGYGIVLFTDSVVGMPILEQFE